MTRNRFDVKIPLSLLALCATLACAAPPPNIIVVLVDDMGWSDIGCYGSEIATPHLDSLAKGGLKFTQFHNTGRCCPTRASLLTGLYPHQAGVGHMTDNAGLPAYQGFINDTSVTIPEVLKPAGYFTAMVGKWHVGQQAGVTPWTRGFDRSLNAAAGGFYMSGSPKSTLFLNGNELEPNDPVLPKDWYSTDLWTSFGLKFIDEALAEKKPFFLYVAHNAPHFPLQAPAEDIARFRGKYMDGWDKLRVQRHEKQLAMGLLDKAWPIAPRPDAIAAWDSLTDKQKDHFDHLMAVYSAVVARMDKSIGNLVAGLKERGVLDNTLILFMSDNGGNAEAGPNGKANGDPTETNSSWFCGESWAMLQNTPFRRYKHYNHEGGTSTPLIAHWPSGITAKDEIRTQPGHLIDLMATCVDISGATYPKEFKGRPITPMEGKSLVPVFSNKTIDRDAIYWEHEGNAAIRVGDSKLVRLGRDGTWELYDMKADRTEQHDLATTHPEKAKALEEKWNAWAARAHVTPYPKQTNAKAKKKDKALN